MFHRRKYVLFVTLFPTHLFGQVQYSLITSSQPITTEPLTNNTQSNQMNKKRKNSSDICFSFSYISNILKVNFDQLRVKDCIKVRVECKWESTIESRF